MPEAIYQRPSDYDLEHEGDDRDVRFYQRLSRRLGARRVLELACGSGRVALPLASALTGGDACLVGVELADEMLAEARRKLDDADESVRRLVTLVQGDMRCWRSVERFDLVLVACSSITHLHSIDDQLALWSNAFDHLEPGGRFVVDITVPDLGAYAESLRTPPRAVTETDLDQTDPESGERLIRQRTTRFDLIEQRADIQFLYDRFSRDAHVERYVSDFTSHVFFPRELQLLYRLAGFDIETVWADYTFQPPRAGTREIVLVGRKPAKP
jgi:SAM-dependent methyltransferase